MIWYDSLKINPPCNKYVFAERKDGQIGLAKFKDNKWITEKGILLDNIIRFAIPDTYDPK